MYQVAVLDKKRVRFCEVWRDEEKARTVYDRMYFEWGSIYTIEMIDLDHIPKVRKQVNNLPRFQY